ncbi:MAG: family 78 glycoside hydrolase catalytic domain, partial [Terrimicrobiaceae bacterium]
MDIINLRCNHCKEPKGMDARYPSLSWEPHYPAGSSNAPKSWRVVVASTPAKLDAPDLWDSGWIDREGAVLVEYAGLPLVSSQECHWQVIARDGSGQEMGKAASFWTMGLLERADWSAYWIGLDSAPEYPADPLLGARWIWDGNATSGGREFRASFDLDHDCEGTLWGLADDTAEVELNGIPIAQLARAQANFNLFPLPQAIGVKGLKAGRNHLLIRAKKLHDRDPYGGVIFRLLAGGQEVAEVQRTVGIDFVGSMKSHHEGGKSIVTDGSWLVRSGDTDVAVQELGSFGVPPWHMQSTLEYPNLPSRYLRREFHVTSPVRKATLSYSGLGLSVAYLNGIRIGEEELSPLATDYLKTVFYRTFDVTALILNGDNALGCILGNGRFFAPRTSVPVRMESYGCPKLLLQLDLLHADGSGSRVISDSQWKIRADGAIGWNNEFDGEYYDARKDDPSWTLPGHDDSLWGDAQIVCAPLGLLCAQSSNPIRKGDAFSPCESWETKYGTRIFDFGVNLVGWCRAKINGRAGAQLTLQFSEEIESRDALSLENLRSALCADHVTLREGITEFEPLFTYHGFRYLEVRGDYESIELAACFVHDEIAETGSFDCSDALVNQIVAAAGRGIRGNYRGMPTDCPQRDERMGWLGDRAGGAPGEMFLFDVEALYGKWLGDIRDSQAPSGAISDIAPPFWRMMYSDNVTWPSCLGFISHWLYRHYGDVAILRQNFEALRSWLTNMSQYLEGDLLSRDIYGDWCVPPESPHLIHSERADRKTSATMLASSYFSRNLELGASFARELGHHDLAEAWSACRTRIAAALNAKFYDPETGAFDNGSQTAALLPLAFDLVPTGNRKKVFDYLVSRITETGAPILGTGLVGAQWLMRTLTAHGRADLAAALIKRDEYPSWGYMIRKGATTIWELWNGDTAEPHMNSRNHVMLLGDLLSWLYEDVAGIQPRAAGFSQIGLRPHFVFDAVSCSHRTVHGTVSSGWTTTNDTIRWHISLPVGTTTECELPAACRDSLRVNDEVIPLRELSTEEGRLVQATLPPGQYTLVFQRPG